MIAVASRRDRWYWLGYLDGPFQGATALYGFWPPHRIPEELPGGYRLTSDGRGYMIEAIS